MLLTISTTHIPATDLGYLLHKNPARCQSFNLSFGKAHVFFPMAEDDECTAALLMDLDPIGLVRGRSRGLEHGTLAQYVNDRPYVASSFFSVAIAQVFGTALGGRSKERPELADKEIPLTANLSVVPSRGGETFLKKLFEPLGYEIKAERLPLDSEFPEWGESAYFKTTLKKRTRLHELLSHLYVLLPVLDNSKHYWIGQDELKKLLEKGRGWLSTHPEKEQIARRYLVKLPRLSREALQRLAEESDPDPDASEERFEKREFEIEEKVSLSQQRIGSVIASLKQADARRVLDVGCGEGRLLGELIEDKNFVRVVGMDVSPRSLEKAANRLRLDRLPPKKRERIELFQGSLNYRDDRLRGYDAMCIIEVIEHLDPSRLFAFERVVFEFAAPPVVIVTTPNIEYNTRFEGLPGGALRHGDHRFEWSRREFERWGAKVAECYHYSVKFLPIGPKDSELGAPTQMGVFRR